MQASISLVKFVAAHYAFGTLLGLISYIIGLRLTRRVVYNSFWEEISVCVSLGLGTLAYIIFLLGIFRLLYPSVILLAIIVCLAASYPVYRQLAGRVLSTLKGARLRAKSLVAVLLFGLSIPILMLPLYPPTSFDATLYFLASAKVYAQSHQISVTPYLRLPVFTQLNEMLFTLALALYDDIAAHVIQLLMLLILTTSVVAFCKRYFSEHAGWWAAAILLANPLVIAEGCVADVDISLMLFGTMAAYSFWTWFHSREAHWLTLSGVFCGLAASAKYPGLFFPLVFGIVTLYVAIRERKYTYPLRLAAVSLAAAPWYIRNFYYTGNPVFPFFPQIFGYSLWTAEDVQALVGDLQRHGVGRSLSALLSLPWHLTFNQDAFLSGGIHLSKLYFFALPLLALFIIKDIRIRKVMGFASAFMIFWFFSSQVLRYLLPAIPMMSLATAASLDMLLCWIPFTRKSMSHWIVAAMIFAVFAFEGWQYSLNVWQGNGPIPVTSEQRDNYLTQRLPSYPAYKLLNNLRGQNYTLYSVSDENMAYFVDGFHMGDFFGPARYTRIFDKISDGQDLYTELKSLGADYLLVNNQRWTVGLPKDSFFHENFQLIYTRANVLVFELGGANSLQRSFGPQLIQNPSFESVKGGLPVGWGYAGNPVVDTSGQNSYAGSSAVRCLGAYNIFSQSVPIRPGSSYFLSFQIRGVTDGQTARIQVNWSDTQGKLLSTYIEVIKAGARWERRDTTLTAPEQAANAIIYASCHDNGVAWFDDFSFAEVKLQLSL